MKVKYKLSEDFKKFLRDRKPKTDNYYTSHFWNKGAKDSYGYIHDTEIKELNDQICTLQEQILYLQESQCSCSAGTLKVPKEEDILKAVALYKEWGGIADKEETEKCLTDYVRKNWNRK